jgi:YHS domain-containing protein
MKERTMKSLLTVFILFFSQIVSAADPISTSYFSSKAVSGYDTVAYFTEGKPVKGDDKFKLEYMGAEWYFSSQAHLDMFSAQPEKYAPQYGGYCAWAISDQKKFAPSDPTQWAIQDGKLYLNYNQSVKSKWDAARALHIKQADENWPGLINQ